MGTLLLLLLLLPPAAEAADNTNLIYKGCSDQKLQDPSLLKPLLASLVSDSSQKPFAAATQNAITAAYQCRGDLSNADCRACVAKIPAMLPALCGADVAAARVQLAACYLRYQAVGFGQAPATQLLYKACGSRTAADAAGFEAKREAAFQMAENGGGLFYTGSYQSLYVLAQCEGSLGNADCGDCVRSAAEQAKTQCTRAISAQVYLQSCYVSYSFYPNGVPSVTSSSAPAEGGHQHTARTVALAVGGVAALGFFIVFMLFLKSVFKKRGGKR
ncbi:hypothetical protein Fmac_030057 [Flemingia macrophylla]|uniref:Gnk2-homologous domain-containing protein n=1 Tax=Flemingia macrophylla TaxID=520843 RepID=A0ABD1LC28_9FABA